VSYTGAYMALARGLAAAVPNPPKWLAYASTGAAMAARAADLANAWHRRDVPEPEPVEDRLIRFYQEKAEALRKQQASSVQQASPEASQQEGTRTSRYLREEGHSVDTDCFSCASSHLAGQAAALRQAADEAAREGGCGPRCQQWVAWAVTEPSALFARDWTPERARAWPADQRAVVERFSPRIRDLQRKVLDGPHADQRAALVEADALLNESVRFVQSGDPLDHPEVDARIRGAEQNLVLAERADVSAFDPDTATELRHLRQDVGSRVTTPAELIEASVRARQLNERVNLPVYAALTPDRLGVMADEAQRVYDDFKDERVRYERARRGTAA